MEKTIVEQNSPDGTPFIHKRKDGWYFWDETYTDTGPYQSKKSCKIAADEYFKKL